MRLDINLATRPYEDAKEFWTRWGLGVGALALVTLVLLVLATRGWIEAGRDRVAIRQLQEQIAELDSEKAAAQAFLEKAANRSTRDQSQFLNGLIEQKGFSWTRAFEDLERVMPGPLHLQSLKPEINDEGQLELQLVVIADTRASALDLVHRMEGSQHFQGSQLVEEAPVAENGAVVNAKIVAVYVPDQPNRSAR